MNKRFIPNLIALALILVTAHGLNRADAQTPTPNSAAASQNLEGTWEGALDVGAMKLRLALKVTRAADGALAAKLDSLDQGANDLPVDVITLKEGSVHFEMKHLQGVFDGTLNKEGALILKANGASAEALARQRAGQEMMFAVLKQEKDNAVAEKKMREGFDKQMAGASEAEKTQAKQTLDAQISMTLSPWFRHFLTYDPRPALARVKCPVLALNGENDLQVPATENLREIEATLKAAGNKDVTVVRMPKLNHLFQTSETGSPGEYAKIEETFAPVALKTIGDWILKRGEAK
jgi:pimeloyl-ACP methyl ester carboxylesterase